jgi:predicted DNA-binding ribbon-helix-helix protein
MSAQPSPTKAASAEPANADAGERDPRLAPHFRAIPVGRARKAFRLESVYWQALEAIATRNGRTLNEEVVATLARLGEAGNEAAGLRASVTSDLLDLWRLAAGRHARFDWTGVLDELPGLAFAMTASQNLIAINPLLRERLRTLGLGSSTADGDLRVTLDPSVVAQIERKRAFLDCSICFHRAGSRTIRRARLGPASESPSGSGVLLGFVEA